jgi:nicotinamidase-related amidase
MKISIRPNLSQVMWAVATRADPERSIQILTRCNTSSADTTVSPEEKRKTKIEWAEVCFVPNAISRSKKDPVYRYLATRELLEQPELPGVEKHVELPFPTMSLQKKRYSAFFQTDLEKFLQLKGIKDLIISGVMTNLCCETTARDAFMRDYRVFFLIDGTATGRSEFHIATLKNLGFGFAYLLTCDELIKMLVM